MVKKKTIAVLRGGLSSEKEISNKSASFVRTALKSLGYKVLDVNVDEKFLNWALDNKEVVDVFFNALHGTWGERWKNTRCSGIFRNTLHAFRSNCISNWYEQSIIKKNI